MALLPEHPSGKAEVGFCLRNNSKQGESKELVNFAITILTLDADKCLLFAPMGESECDNFVVTQFSRPIIFPGFLQKKHTYVRVNGRYKNMSYPLSGLENFEGKMEKIESGVDKDDSSWLNKIYKRFSTKESSKSSQESVNEATTEESR